MNDLISELFRIARQPGTDDKSRQASMVNAWLAGSIKQSTSKGETEMRPVSHHPVSCPPHSPYRAVGGLYVRGHRRARGVLYPRRLCEHVANQTVDGVAIYIRDAKTVDDYCRANTAADQSVPGRRNARLLYPARRTIMVIEGIPWVLEHELRHARGEDHRGPCASVPDEPRWRETGRDPV